MKTSTEQMVLRVLAVGLMASTACSETPVASTDEAQSSEPKSSVSDPRFAKRARLAASGNYLAGGPAKAGAGARSLRPADDTPPDWVGALDLTAFGATAVYDGDPSAGNVFPNLGVIQPLRGDSFVLLSTGIAGTPQAEPGTDLFPAGPDGDTTTLRVSLHVPVGANTVSLQYNFLSAEYPEFVNTVFNDTFGISIEDDTDPSGNQDFANVASVNSSFFFPSSNSRARGTGFDLYAVDPSGVNSEFDGTKPDAGLTDFRVFTASVHENHDITLVFTIRDAGDGILDSAVAIDAVQFTALRTLDPNPLLIDATGNVTTDPGQLGDQAKGTPVRAAVADGATKVLLRLQVPALGTMTFSIPGATAPDDGGLLDASGVRQTTVTTQVFPTRDGNNFGVAVYQVPDDFNRCEPGGAPCAQDDSALTERTITLQATYTPAPSDDPSAPPPPGAFTTQVDFQIKRPPVVLAHGLWSDPLDWLNMPLASDPRFAITYTAYTYPCNPELHIVPGDKCPVATSDPSLGRQLCGPNDQDSIALAIQEALANTRRLGIAATRVDLIAHGAAGIHGRQYMAKVDAPGQVGYRNLSNLNAGDVNRFITLNTPHAGSVMADKIVQARGGADAATLTVSDYQCRAATSAAAVLEPTGIDELTTLSIGHLALPATPVPSHALVGTAPAMSPGQATRKLAEKNLMYNDTATLDSLVLFSSSATANAVFKGNNDLFSTMASERGGLPDEAVDVLALNPSTVATGSTYSDTDFFHSLRHPAMSDKLIGLLNRHVGGTAFSAFSGANGFAARAAAPERPAVVHPAVSFGEIHIASPADGTSVISGTSITVTVSVATTFVPVSVIVATTDSVASVDAPPYTVSLAIPARGLGAIPLVAAAIGPDDEVVVSTPLSLTATTQATVDTVRIVTQDPILFGLGTHRALGVLGDYDDGFTRVITAGTTGTTYTSSSTAIATVSADGVVTAVAPGIATIGAQNGRGFDSITVTVKGNASPVARAGHSVSLSCVAAGATLPVQLDGSASFDPEGDALSYAWSEGGVQIASGPSPTVALGAGTHVIDLEVSDGLSPPSHDTVTISTTTDTVPPVLAIAGDNPQKLECAAPFVDSGATAVDACDGDLSASVTAASHVDPHTTGTYTVDYQVHDKVGLTAAASRAVIVADRTPPVLAIVGDNPQALECGTAFTDRGATAADACDGDVSASVAAASHVDPAAPGSYTVDYQAHDKAGLTASASRVVQVADHTPPVLSLVGPNPLVAECAAPFVDPGATASDLCDGNLTGAIAATSHVDPSHAGSYTVDYRVTDRAGQTATASRAVVVADRTPPHVSIAPMRQLFPPTNLYREFSLADCAAATDSCSGAVDIARAGQIVAIYSDERDATFPFDPGHDIVILGPSRFKLRDQSDPFGNGRVYEIEFTVRDAQGNATGSNSCFIGVRSLLHPASTPIDDGRRVTVRP